MLQSIHIQGFKGFKDTQIAPLRKVNLILGGQNVGKTSLLEAVYLGASPVGNVQGLPRVFRLAEGRDSQRFLEMTFKKNKGIVELGLDLDFVRENGIVKNLQEKEFFGLITGINNSINTFSDVIFIDSFSVDELLISKLIHTNIIEKPVDPTVLLSQKYGLKASSSFEDSLNTKFFKYPLAIPVNPPTQAEAVKLLDQVVLKRKKRTLLEALSLIEPRLIDINSLSPDDETRVYLELDGLDTAVPLPQLGHGFSRLLHLYCSLLVTDAKLALMDEVENGIHYASLPILFQGVRDMAVTQGVQTLMTTHSWEAIRAAYNVFVEADALDDFQLIRLEREGDNIRAVVINDEQLVTAMESGYEIR